MIAPRPVFDTLVDNSVVKQLDPLDVPLDQAPNPDRPWLPECMLSLYGTPVFEQLSAAQKRLLSQLEFSLMCSISCSGEKEVIGNLARLMLKKRFAPVRRYIFHFIKEENNHIYVFSEFCERYGKFYPSLYSYAQGDLWEDDELDDLMVFVHILTFEELGHGLNELVAQSEGIPPLVRAINRYHVADEGRHISFGRHIVRDMAKEILGARSPEVHERIRAHVRGFIGTRHIDYHNMHVYKAVGIRDAYRVRERLVNERGIEFFVKDRRTERRVGSLLRFLASVGLLNPSNSTIEPQRC